MRNADMKEKRKAVDALDAFYNASAGVDHKPDRFKWALEDYRRWLMEGLVEWEQNEVIRKLKG